MLLALLSVAAVFLVVGTDVSQGTDICRANETCDGLGLRRGETCSCATLLRRGFDSRLAAVAARLSLARYGDEFDIRNGITSGRSRLLSVDACAAGGEAGITEYSWESTHRLLIPWRPHLANNMFHLLNDNVLALWYTIRVACGSVPCPAAVVLEFDPLKSGTMLPQARRLVGALVGDGGVRRVVRVVGAGAAQRRRSSVRAEQFDVVVGHSPHFFYSRWAAVGENATAAAASLRCLALAEAGVSARSDDCGRPSDDEQDGPVGGVLAGADPHTNKPLAVVFVQRQKGETAADGRRLRAAPPPRYLKNGGAALLEAFELLGATSATTLVTSHPWPRQLEVLANASIVVGVHGAGLANAVFARRGVVVVELQTPGFAGHETQRLFRSVAASRKGGYLLVRLASAKLSRAAAYRVAACALEFARSPAQAALPASCAALVPQLSPNVHRVQQGCFRWRSLNDSNRDLIPNLQHEFRGQDGGAFVVEALAPPITAACLDDD